MTTETVRTQRKCQGCLRLKIIYDTHRGGRTVADADWEFVQKHLAEHAVAAVAASKAKIPAFAVETAKFDLETLLLEKFLRLKFDGVENFEGYLWLMASRDLITALRKIRSVPSSTESAAATKDDPSPLDRTLAAGKGSDEMADPFGQIRERFPEPRWPLYAHVREVLLGFLLDYGRWPSPKICTHVPQPIRIHVFNASLCEVNQAMEERCAKA